ncbi:MAG TPA: response regulator transcription factor [Polyangiaceae bacterium]|jgi:two-component system phosphate regulon response regulator PhoB
MARVLIIDDDREAREVLEEQLRRAGHGAQTSATATDGVRLARERRPDVVLLDAELPDMTPAGVCRALEGEMATRGVPVIVMLAIDQEEVVGATGVADSIAKPFSVRELLLHVESALKRARPEVDPTRPIEFGILRVDRDAQRVWVAGNEVTLTPLEYKLLVTLHDRRDQVQSRDTLLSDVWGISADVTTRTVDTHVKRLRSKLGEAADYVQTVRGVGYRFAASPEDHG